MFRYLPLQNFQDLFSPEDAFGNTEEEVVEEPIEEEEEDEESEEPKEDEEEESKDKKDKDEEEDIQLVRADYKELKKEFPTLFTKYPSLKHAFFREQQFTELFPTVEDARNAVEAQEAFLEIRDAITSGDSTKFIRDLKEEDESGFKKFASGFLPSLLEHDKDTFIDIISPVVLQHIKNVFDYGRKLENKEDATRVQNAAKIVRKVLFGGEYDDIEKASEGLVFNKAKSKEQEEFEKEKNQHLTSKYSALYKEVADTCYLDLEKEIDKGLSDLKERPGVKRMVLKEVKEKVLSEMDKDKAYLSRLNALWKKEQRNGFNGSNKESIKTVFLSKAKTLIPKLRAEVRKDTVGLAKKDDNDNEERGRPTVGKTSSGKSGKMDVARVKKEGLTTRQIFD